MYTHRLHVCDGLLVALHDVRAAGSTHAAEGVRNLPSVPTKATAQHRTRNNGGRDAESATEEKYVYLSLRQGNGRRYAPGSAASLCCLGLWVQAFGEAVVEEAAPMRCEAWGEQVCV